MSSRVAVNLNGVSFLLAIPHFPYLSPRECHLPRLMAQSLVEQAETAGLEPMTHPSNASGYAGVHPVKNGKYQGRCIFEAMLSVVICSYLLFICNLYK